MRWVNHIINGVLLVLLVISHSLIAFMNMKGEQNFQQLPSDLIMFRNPYCQECYSECVAPKCVACGLPILSIYTAALGGYWHPKCFVCQEPGCGPFDKAKFFELNGKPYCEKHYLQRIGKVCLGILGCRISCNLVVD